MLSSIDDIRKTYDECVASKCKDCPLNTVVDLIPASVNGVAVRGSVCDLITTLNSYYVTKISHLLK